MAQMHQLANLIDGHLVPAQSGNWLDNHDPATGQAYSQIPDSDEQDINAAVEAAVAAFENWSTLASQKRADYLLALADLVERDVEQLARAESIDTGKPISLARTVDIPRAVTNLRFFAAAVLHEHSEAHFTDSRVINYTLHQPVGVAGCISPWNLPLYLFTWKIAPALAVGCTVVGKPSEVTPMTAYLLGKLSIEAGLPPGVLNIVHGRGATAGAALVEHEDVPAISFTGGTATGQAIARTASPMLKKLSLELGGKNPFIVFSDANIDEAITHAVRAAFTNQGQICLCGSRIFVQRSCYEKFLQGVIEAARSMAIGDPLEPDTAFGAQVSKEHWEKIRSYIELAKQEGGTIECGGEPPSPNDLPQRVRGGCFMQPTIITGLDVNCRTNQEEIFGPVATVMPFDDETEVIQWANSTRYGLAAMLWTTDLDRAHRVANLLDAGTVWINCWMIRDLRVPFGGMKQSGVGREGGAETLHFFTEQKNVCIRVRREQH